MFPQPWSPTKCFPHPLSNMGFDSQWSNQNYYSYLLVDEFMWLGLGSIINTFRKQVGIVKFCVQGYKSLVVLFCLV